VKIVQIMTITDRFEKKMIMMSKSALGQYLGNMISSLNTSI